MLDIGERRDGGDDGDLTSCNRRFSHRVVTRRINAMNRISTCIKILVQTCRIFDLSFVTVVRPEPASERIHEAGAEIVEAEVGVELFASVKVAVVGGTGGGDQRAE